MSFPGYRQIFHTTAVLTSYVMVILLEFLHDNYYEKIGMVRLPGNEISLMLYLAVSTGLSSGQVWCSTLMWLAR